MVKKYKYNSYENVISLDFIKEPFYFYESDVRYNYKPQQVLYRPVDYYTVEKDDEDYRVTLYDSLDNEVDELLMDTDDPDDIKSTIEGIEESLVKGANELYEFVFIRWKKDKVYETINSFIEILKKKLPQDIKKLPYADFKIEESDVSESLYIHFIKNLEPDDEDQDWYYNGDWDLKVRFSSHPIPSSSGPYGKTHLNFDIDEKTKPEKLYKDLLYWIDNIKETPEFTEFIDAQLITKALNRIIGKEQ